MMYTVTYNVKSKSGFLETKVEKFATFQSAIQFVRTLNRSVSYGRPILEKI